MRRRGSAPRDDATGLDHSDARPAVVSTCSSMCSPVASASPLRPWISVWNRWSRFSSAPSTCVSTASGSSAATSREMADVALDRVGAVAALEVRGVDADVAEERVRRVAEHLEVAALGHVAVVVDPRGVDRRLVQAQRSRRIVDPSRVAAAANSRASCSSEHLARGVPARRGAPAAARRGCRRAGARARAPTSPSACASDCAPIVSTSSSVELRDVRQLRPRPLQGRPELREEVRMPSSPPAMR